jgi:hypothetical protein
MKEIDRLERPPCRVVVQVRDGVVEVVSGVGGGGSLTLRVIDDETQRLAEQLIGDWRAA